MNNDKPLSPAWCASVDAELDETAAADAAMPVQMLNEPSYEQQRAIMEAQRNDSLRIYTDNYPGTTARTERAYEIGFSAGWDRHASLASPAPLSHPKSIAAAAVPAPVAQLSEPTKLAFDKTHIDYIDRYGGFCRDCADEDGVCPSSGLPCGGSKKAIRHVLAALAYGVNHGYIPVVLAAAPTTPKD